MVNNKCGNGFIPNGSYATFSVTELSYTHGNKKFMLKVESSVNQSLSPVYSNPFVVVYADLLAFKSRNYRLIIKNPVPTEWFKDEGGKRNHITLDIELVVVFASCFDHKDVAGRTCTSMIRGDRLIPLNLSLLYDDYSSVRTAANGEGSSILKVFSDQSLSIDENVCSFSPSNEQGCCQLNVRIESVSKNHNSKPFVIYVFPNLTLYPQNADIAGVYTTPIKVKSKRASKSENWIIALTVKKEWGTMMTTVTGVLAT